MDYDKVHQTILLLKEKYQLIDFNFDTEAIYQLGDLSTLLKKIIEKTPPDCKIEVSESYSLDGKQYVATLLSQGIKAEIFADVDSDWLQIPFLKKWHLFRIFKTGLKYYSINPAIGLTGQDALYFCGTDDNLRNARMEGIPLVFPGEDATETQEFKAFNTYSK